MRTRKLLQDVRGFTAEQIYRFLAGYQFMVFVNFILLVLAASDKMEQIAYAHLGILISGTWIAVILIPLGLFGVWVWGFILDVSAFMHHYNRNLNERNPIWDTLIGRLDRIEKKLKGR